MNDSLKLDEFDRHILKALQRKADYSMADLGEKVGLSHTPCWRRIKRLESEGIIKARVTLLNARKLDLKVIVFAYVVMKQHDEASLNVFENSVMDVDEIVECYLASGEKDYVLRVIVSSVDDYERLLKGRILQLPNVESVNSTFALKQVKYSTELPL